MLPPTRLNEINATLPQMFLCMSIRFYPMGSMWILVSLGVWKYFLTVYTLGIYLGDIVGIFLEHFLLDSYSSMLDFSILIFFIVM